MTLANVRAGGSAARGAMIAAAAALAVFAAAAASAQDKAATAAPETEPAKITVEGAASRVVAADATVIQWRTNVLRDTAAEAADGGEAVFAAVLAALEAAGAARDDLATTSVGLAPQWDYSGDTRTISGYRWTTRVRLDVEGTGTAGDLIDAIVSAGGDEIAIDSVDFTAEVTPALERELLTAAVRDAVAQAAAAGEAIDRAEVRPAEIRSVRVYRAGPPVGPYEIADGAAANAAGGPTVVEARVVMAFTAGSAVSGATAAEPVSIWVSGSAARELEPDETRINFDISVLHGQAAMAVRNGASTLSQVLARVRALQVDAQVFTRSVSLYQERNWVAGESVPVGFRYRVGLMVAADGTSEAGALLRALVQGGGDAVQIRGISFKASTSANVQRGLLGDAISDAGRVAGIASATLGYGTPRAVEIRIGEVEAVAEAEAEEEAEYATEEIAFGAADARTSIQEPSTIPGAQSVRASARVQFEFAEPPADEE